MKPSLHWQFQGIADAIYTINGLTGIAMPEDEEETSVGWFDTFRREKREAAEEKNQVVESSIESPEETLVTESEENDFEGTVPGKEQEGQSQESFSTEESADPEPWKEETSATEGAEEGLRTYKDKKPVRHVVGMTKILAIINQKGGVGKSTTAVNLSAALGASGKQVLLVDLDPQGNATSGLGVEKNQVSQCIYDVLLNDVPLEDIIIPDVCEGLDLAPATINLAGAEVELVSEMARENRLRDAVGSMRGKYDYIFIDCPPSLGLLTVNALVSCDKLIIPIQTEFYALEGVTKLLESMKRVKNRLNPGLDIFGILLTMYDGRTTLSRQVAAEVRNFFGSQVFETIIPRTVKLSEAPSYGLPINQYDPLGKGAVAYDNLAKEVIKRG
jgi:chromosome partitioning protein